MLPVVKICPACQSRYDDDNERCPVDGEELVDLPEALPGNPRLAEPVAASPADRTSMIDLEAIEAKRKKRAPEPTAGDGEGEEDGDERTPPPAEPLEEDGEATGTLHRARGRRRDPTQVRARAPRSTRGAGIEEGDDIDDLDDVDDGDDVEGGEDGGDLPDDRRVNEELTDREMSRTGRSRRRSRQGTAVDGTGVRERPSREDTERVRGGTRTGMTRGGTQVKARGPRRVLTGTQAAFIALVTVVGLIGAIIFVARSTAVLTVTTVPPGAEVILDGKVLGLSPVQKRVRTGSHVVELHRDDYEPFKEVIDVPTGGLPFLQPLQKKPPPPPPPPTPAQIAEELATSASQGFAAGDLDLAKKKLDDALKLVPEHAGAKALLPKVAEAIAQRDAQALRAEAAAAREARLRQARVLAEEGQRLYNKNQLGPAKEKLYASLRLDADNPEPHRTLGRIFNREDQVDKVRYHLQRYLDLGGADGDFKVREWLKAHPR